MGNEQSKKGGGNSNSEPGSSIDRGIMTADIVPNGIKDLKCRAIPDISPDTPETPTSDIESEFSRPGLTDSPEPFEEIDIATGVREPGAPESEQEFSLSMAELDIGLEEIASSSSEEFLTKALHCRVVKRFYMLYIEGFESLKTDVLSLPIANLDPGTKKDVINIAMTVGFAATTEPNQSLLFLQRPTVQDIDDRRRIAAKGLLMAKHKSLSAESLSVLDTRIAASVKTALHLQFNSLQNSAPQSVCIDSRTFIEDEEGIKNVVRELCNEFGFSLTIDGYRLKVSKANEESKKAAGKVFLEGELVWRRLQHWSTNVRKEKKFNIWTKGLDEDIKNKIIDLALEVDFKVGFETAYIQPNGNIHVEIKPPEGQTRRKLRHATDPIRDSLKPLDAAVAENVLAKIKSWLEEFTASNKQKDSLNCRFALPAEWIRKHAEAMAVEHKVRVDQRTGVDLEFIKVSSNNNSTSTVSDTETKNENSEFALRGELQSKRGRGRKTERKPYSPHRGTPSTIKRSGGGVRGPGWVVRVGGGIGIGVGDEEDKTNGFMSHRLSVNQETSIRGGGVGNGVARGHGVGPGGRRANYGYGWDPSWPGPN